MPREKNVINAYLKGDITETTIRNIAHGVNCQNAMGSGVAKALFTKWPEVKKQYHEYIDKQKSMNFTDISLLGTIQAVGMAGDDKWVFNCFTQRFYGRDSIKYVNYEAIYECFKTIAKTGIGELAIPKIGCGLANGNWGIVEQIINDAVGDKVDITVYYL